MSFLNEARTREFWAKVKTGLSAKQDALLGQPGQVVGFGADGKPEAQDPPDTGVTSFKGRTGAVTPQAGDYSAQQVGALPITGGTMEGDVEIPWGKNVSFGLDVPGIGGLAFSPDPDRNIDRAHFGFVDDADRFDEEVVRIGGIAAPKYSDEAANKKYVDSLYARIGPKVELLYAAQYGLEVQIEQVYNGTVVERERAIFPAMGDAFKSDYQGRLQHIGVTYVRLVPPEGLAFTNLHWTGTLALHIGNKSVAGSADKHGVITFGAISVSAAGSTSFSFESGGHTALFKVELA